jgi:hypothetical protein
MSVSLQELVNVYPGTEISPEVAKTFGAVRPQTVNPQLEAKLLAIQPGRVVQPFADDSYTALLVSHGSQIGGPVQRTRGLPNRCHYNASLRWLKNPKATIFFGYQNPSGEVWTQHSWNVCNGKILDTDDRSLYFGVTPDDPAIFAATSIIEELGHLNLADIATEIGVTAFMRFQAIVRACVVGITG